jgi:glycosyltransferase involved in cell wall biosynthesis
MKILQLSKFYPPVFGGIEFFVFDLVEEMSNDVQCDVLCSNIGGRTVVEERERYRVIRCGSLGRVFSTSISPPLIGRLRQLGDRYDIVHVHLPNPMANLAYYLTRPGSRLVVHWHSDILRQKTLLALYRPLQDWLLRRADVIVATSQNYLDNSEHLKGYRDKCVVIPLGLNTSRLISCQEKAEEIGRMYEPKPIVFSLGRLVYYKGLNYLIEAMKRVDACLLIGGSGPLKESLEKQVLGSSLDHKVFVLGDIDQEDLGAYYQACDVFCLPSVRKTEAFGLVQVEAMYFGKAVVSTAIPGSGVSWVNRDGVTGLVVRPEDPEALSDALNRLIADAGLRGEFGRNGRQRFDDKLNIKVVAKEMLRVYSDVVQGEA